MNLRETIHRELSKDNCTKIVNWVSRNQQRFDELAKLFLKEDPVIQSRAGWALSELVKKYPGLVSKHLGNIIKQVKQPAQPEGVKRNTVRLLQHIDIPKRYHGDVMNLCFDYVISPIEKPAVKAFSLTVLHHLSDQYPDIRSELKTIIEDRWDLETAAFHSRGRKILKALS